MVKLSYILVLTWFSYYKLKDFYASWSWVFMDLRDEVWSIRRSLSGESKWPSPGFPIFKFRFLVILIRRGSDSQELGEIWFGSVATGGSSVWEFSFVAVVGDGAAMVINVRYYVDESENLLLLGNWWAFLLGELLVRWRLTVSGFTIDMFFMRIYWIKLSNNKTLAYRWYQT